MQPTLRHILVPVDGSTHAVKATAMAALLARGTHARITLVHVLDLQDMPLLGASALSRQELAHAADEVAQRAVGAARDALDSAGAQYETVTLRGEPGSEIVRHVQEQGVDLIVVGSRGLSPLGQILLGSVSSYVLHHALCAVTVAR